MIGLVSLRSRTASRVAAALAAATVTVVPLAGCASVGGKSSTRQILRLVTTVPVASSTTPHHWGRAFVATARVAIGKGGQGKPTRVRCSATVTIIVSGHRRSTALCTAVTDATCGEWFVYREDAQLAASLWRYQPISACHGRGG